MSVSAWSKLHPKIRIAGKNGNEGLFAVDAIAEGEILIDLNGEEPLRAPTRESLQVGEGSHVVGRRETVGYLNHACEPSAYLDFTRLSVRALHDIAAGREITVNYLTTEYDMHDSFRCHCGSPVCFGLIRGFRHLSYQEQLRLEPLLAPYLRVRLRAEDQAASHGTAPKAIAASAG
jgi:hypothetical protein